MMAASEQEIIFQSATQLADHMKRKQLSPVEVVEAYCRQIEKVNPIINAYIHVMWDDAILAAKKSEAKLLQGEGGPLEGVPIAIKDNMPVAGTPLTNGSAMSSAFPSRFEGHLVNQLRHAGAIMLGKTNLPEFATLPVTENQRFGATRNPWNTDYTPGGSSGGSAAAVAAGMAPVAHGNDGGGSLRIPGSACGLFAMKPSRGRISNAPFLGDVMNGLAVQGFLSRSVTDNALLLDITSGFVSGDPYTAPSPHISFSGQIKERSSPLRIGWTVMPLFPVSVHSVCVKAVHETVSLLEQLGHCVEEYTPIGWQDPDLWNLFMDVWSAGISWGMQLDIAEGLSPEAAEPHNRDLWQQGLKLSAADYLVTITKLQQYSRRVLAAFQNYDILLTPTLAEPPMRIGEMFEYANGDTDLLIKRGGQFTPFTSIANVTGQPAMQIPALWVDGLPIGVQLIGSPYSEAALFQLAVQIEQERPWDKLRPPVG